MNPIKFSNKDRKNFIDEICKIKQGIPAGTDYNPIKTYKKSYYVCHDSSGEKKLPEASYLSEALYLG
jgi:hypothetical protein